MTDYLWPIHLEVEAGLALDRQMETAHNNSEEPLQSTIRLYNMSDLHSCMEDRRAASGTTMMLSES